jgi:DNA N-6-adenine-methyltransferase (Dam)
VTTLFEVTAADVADTNDEWYTPRWIFDAAGLTFDLDVCAPVAPEFRSCPARRYLTVVEDGLVAPWEGVVWMNPPYSRPHQWVDRFAAHPSGLALLPAATGLWRGVLTASADAIALINVSAKEKKPGGIRNSAGFGRPDGSQTGYPFALILAARGPVAVQGLARVAMRDQSAGGAYHVRPVSR